jgi:hypothetical protein
LPSWVSDHPTLRAHDSAGLKEFVVGYFSAWALANITGDTHQMSLYHDNCVQCIRLENAVRKDFRGGSRSGPAMLAYSAGPTDDRTSEAFVTFLEPLPDFSKSKPDHVRLSVVVEWRGYEWSLSDLRALKVSKS